MNYYKSNLFFIYQICFQTFPNFVISALFLSDVHIDMILKINTYDISRAMTVPIVVLILCLQLFWSKSHQVVSIILFYIMLSLPLLQNLHADK